MCLAWEIKTHWPTTNHWKLHIVWKYSLLLLFTFESAILSGGNVIIVIGGDNKYKGEDEEEREVISRWAKRKVFSQFSEEYLDGRKSFIFSWNKQHREIHEQALRHHFDPNKKGLKFGYQLPLLVQETNPKSLPQATSTEFENLRTPKSPLHNDEVATALTAAREKLADNHLTGVSTPKNRDGSRNIFLPSSGEIKG